MSNTRYNNDQGRIEKKNTISTFAGRYALDTPGPGDSMPFNADPHIRIQGWGANFKNNMVDINSDLRGMTRPFNRDLVGVNEHAKWSVKPESHSMSYETVDYVTDESRATHPAWTYRDIEVDRWEQPFLNPLDKVEVPIQRDLNTRMLEKDYFKRQVKKSVLTSEPIPYNQ
jgi:hypothetical protein